LRLVTIASIRPRVIALVVVLLAALAAVPAAAASGDYPRLGLYGCIHGNGNPFYNYPADTTLDPVVLDEIARYGEVILDVNPVTPYRTDILAALRQRNPNVRLLGYVTGHNIWGAADADSLNHFPTRYRRLVRDLDGFLYDRLSGQLFAEADVNLAKRDAGGRYVVAEGLADLFYDAVVSPHQWDGVFLDVYCSTILWLQDASHQIDYSRAGYSSLAAFDASWAVGADTLANRLRRLSGATPILVGNCAISAHHGVFNGWMRENFPMQSGGSWYTNVLADPNGYLADDRDYLQVTRNHLFTAMVGGTTTQYSSENARKVRFGLASAALGDGYGVFGPSDRNVDTAPYHTWWYDEYAVDVASGRTATDLAHTGWLGQPLGSPYQMVWVGSNPDLVSNPGFEQDITSGWSMGLFAPAQATFQRDTTTAAVGRASCHITVTATGPSPWDANYTTTSALAVTAGGTYAVTFWARSSAPRVVPIYASYVGGGGDVGHVAVWVDATWRQYQVIILPTESRAVVLGFFLGQQVGDLWIDDVHCQQGATSVWRRDFQNGMIMINPGTTPLTVPLGATWRRILGTVDPATNDGSSITTVTVNPSDATFLLRSGVDNIPPAAVHDAHVKP
jgi:hypothetical protein